MAKKIVGASTALSQELFGELHPFHCRIDRKGVVLGFGQSLAKVWPELELGVQIQEAATLERPRSEIAPETMDKLMRTSVVLAPKDGLCALRGQFVPVDDGNVVFIGSPWLTDGRVFGSALGAKDFAVHDPVLDYLFLIQAQNAGMADLRELNTKLREQRELLRVAHRSLAAEYHATAVMSDGGELCDALPEVLQGLIDALGVKDAVIWQSVPGGPDRIVAIAHAEGQGFAPSNYVLGHQGWCELAANEEPNSRSTLRVQALADHERVVCEIRSGSRDWGKLEVFVPESAAAPAVFECIEHVGRRLGQFVALRRAESDAVERRRQWAAELHAAVEDAKTANRIKGDFLANISHEIRTPMNAVMGLSELLVDSDLPAASAELAATIRNAASSLVGLLNDGLDLSKMESGKLELRDEEFDLHEVFEDVCELLAGGAFEKGLDFWLDIDASVPRLVVGDSLRTRQVVTNLVSNAIKFTEHGTVSLRASGSEVDGRFAVRVDVSDTGRGISEVDCARIFEPFYQADSSSTRRVGGTGLGLMIARQLAELMGGSLKVHSSPGLGSTFSFVGCFEVAEFEAKPADELARAAVVGNSCYPRLHSLLGQRETQVDIVSPDSVATWCSETGGQYPLFIEAGPENESLLGELASSGQRVIALVRAGDLSSAKLAQELAVPAIAVPVRRAKLNEALARKPLQVEAKEPTPSTSNTRVLIVDDAPLNRLVAEKFLAGWGYETHSVEDGAAAVQAVSEGNFDLVLMDCQMPLMDGYEASRTIRALPGAVSEIPIIAMTAHSLEGDRERCLAAGMSGYASKPIESADLKALLESTLRSEPAGGWDCFSESRLDELRGLEKLQPGLLCELLELFDGELSDRMTELREALTAGQWMVLKKGAHRLKGSAANIGASDLAQACAELEGLADSADEQVIARSFGTVLAVAQRTKDGVGALREVSSVSQVSSVPN